MYSLFSLNQHYTQQGNQNYNTSSIKYPWTPAELATFHEALMIKQWCWPLELTFSFELSCCHGYSYFTLNYIHRLKGSTLLEVLWPFAVSSLCIQNAELATFHEALVIKQWCWPLELIFSFELSCCHGYELSCCHGYRYFTLNEFNYIHRLKGSTLVEVLRPLAVFSLCIQNATASGLWVSKSHSLDSVSSYEEVKVS